MKFTALVSRQRSRLAALLVAAVLVLASCGGASEAELATIDDDSQSSEREAAVPEVPDDEPVELSTADPSEDGDQLPVPDAVVPPAPAPETSPAERQRLQELGVPQAALDQIERLGTPDEDLDDASNPANAQPPAAAAPQRDDLDQFPATIPATVPGAPDPRDRQNDLFDAPTDGGTAPLFTGSDESEPEILIEDGSAGGVEAPTAFESEPVAGDADSESLDLEIDPCADDGCEEVAQVVPTEDSQPSSDDVPTPAEPRESDCVNRPWDRGCEGPAPDPEDLASQFGSDGGVPTTADTDDTTFEVLVAADEEPQGVDVPQEVIDILLTPPESDDPPSEDDSDSGQESDS